MADFTPEISDSQLKPFIILKSIEFYSENKELLGSIKYDNTHKITNPTSLNINDYLIKHSENVTGITCSMGGSTGLIPRSKENQDAYSVTKIVYINSDNIQNEFDIIIGCDGHGNVGKIFSIYTVSEFIQYILDNFSTIIENPLVLKDIFKQFNDKLFEIFGTLNVENIKYILEKDFFPVLEKSEILKNQFIELYQSNHFDKLGHQELVGGTTISLLIKTNGRQIVANLGDFDIVTKIETEPSSIIVTRDGLMLENISNIIKLTEDHSGNSDKEVIRILESGYYLKYDINPDGIRRNVSKINAAVINEIDGVKCLTRIPHKDQKYGYVNNMDLEPASYFCDDSFGINCLNMSRSFGDFTKKFVICEPCITDLIYPVDTITKTILGSDGYFNCFNKSLLFTQFDLSNDEIFYNSLDNVSKTFSIKGGDNMTLIIVT